jgi:MFS family permease
MALALAVGVGRFAYTPLLPSVQRALGFDDATAGAIASSNLLGYMLGAAWARGATGRTRTLLLRLGLGGSLVTTLLLVAAVNERSWAGLRFAGGVASGLVFVLVSAAVLESLPAGAGALAGLLYSGVGTGIALSGAIAASVPLDAGWRLPWLVLAGVSAVLAVPAWSWLVAPPVGPSAGAQTTARPRGRGLARLAIAYFLEGLGYIVSGTFAVAAVQRVPGMEPWAPWVWVAAGVAAAPSPLLWVALARRRSTRFAIVLAYAAQAVGMALPALSSTAWAAFAGALLFGGTFMGIATMTLAAARLLDPTGGPRAIGMLTVVYGIGQVLGPLLAGLVSLHLGDPRPAVLGASVAVAVGAAILAVGSATSS